MSEIKDGGPAFPMQATFSPECGTMPGQEGMTLRDWFAGQALTGFLASTPADAREWPDSEILAIRCFKFADAMIAQREKKS